jgi:alkanesulfonate monooxygenase SsuD/methylene tetrahydromethanopterin reductase-like flavin-dependent oxidoreductase (luciferase family)
MRLVGIGTSREQVEERWLPEVLTLLRGYRRAGAPGDRDESASKRLRGRDTAREKPSGLDALEAMIVAGSPDDVVAGVRRYHDATNCEHFVPTIVGSDPLSDLEFFGRHVIPAFR